MLNTEILIIVRCFAVNCVFLQSLNHHNTDLQLTCLILKATQKFVSFLRGSLVLAEHDLIKITTMYHYA